MDISRFGVLCRRNMMDINDTTWLIMGVVCLLWLSTLIVLTRR